MTFLERKSAYRKGAKDAKVAQRQDWKFASAETPLPLGRFTTNHDEHFLRPFAPFAPLR
jgi:hypothetical protein